MIKKADSFVVENPAWTYGKRVVVMSSDYETLWEDYQRVRELLKKEIEKSAEWERAARHARKQIGVIKVVREVKAGLGLAEAKTLVEGAPKLLLEGANKADADAAAKKIEEAGGKVELK